MARSLTACRTLTTSSEARSGIVSSLSMSICVLSAVNDLTDHGQAFVDVQRGADTGQLQTKFYQGDCDGWTHADDHGHRIEHPGHGSDVVQHAADEGVDDLQRGY